MTRVSKQVAEANKRHLVETASRLFRAKGVDSVGVAEIAREAGLTHGAIYSAFESKAQLAVAALQASREAIEQAFRAGLGTDASIKSMIEQYVSVQQRDQWEQSCPMIASASEAARQDDDYRQAFSGAFLSLVAALQQAMPGNDHIAARSKALTMAAAMVGAVALARSLDAAMSDELLLAARRQLLLLAHA